MGCPFLQPEDLPDPGIKPGPPTWQIGVKLICSHVRQPQCACHEWLRALTDVKCCGTSTKASDQGAWLPRGERLSPSESSKAHGSSCPLHEHSWLSAHGNPIRPVLMLSSTSRGSREQPSPSVLSGSRPWNCPQPFLPSDMEGYHFRLSRTDDFPASLLPLPSEQTAVGNRGFLLGHYFLF